MSTISHFSCWLFSCQAVQKVRGKQIGRKQWQHTNTLSNTTELLKKCQRIFTHIPSGRRVLISPKSRENKEHTELLKTTARQRGMDEQQCWDESEKASLWESWFWHLTSNRCVYAQWKLLKQPCFLVRLMYKCSFFVSSHVSSFDFLPLAEETSFLSKKIFLSPLDQLRARSVLGHCGAEQGLLASLFTCRVLGATTLEKTMWREKPIPDMRWLSVPAASRACASSPWQRYTSVRTHYCQMRKATTAP